MYIISFALVNINDQVFYFSFIFYQFTFLVRTIMIFTVFLICGIHVFDVLCGNYLYFSPMSSAYGLRINLKIMFCSVLHKT